MLMGSSSSVKYLMLIVNIKKRILNVEFPISLLVDDVTA